MGIFYFPCNFVYWKNIQNHSEIKNKLIPKIHKIRDKYESDKYGIYNGITSYTDQSNDILNGETDIINQIVWDPLDAVLKELNSRPNCLPITIEKSFITESWFTEYETGGSFNHHTHMGHAIRKDNRIYIPSFSLVYVLHDENTLNSTEFLQPTPLYVSTEYEVQTTFDTSAVNDIKEGTVLIFPSSLYHGVKSVKLPGRITIAVNVYSCHLNR